MGSDGVTLERNRARLLLLYACRYALGRASGAPLDATEAVRLHADVMRAEDLRGLADDIDGEIRRTAHWGCGARIDHDDTWRAFAAWCRDEARRRDDTDRAAARGGERVLRERGVTL